MRGETAVVPYWKPPLRKRLLMPGVPSKSADTTAPPGILFQVPLVLPTPPVLLQPGTRNDRLMTLRPPTGRLITCFVSMVFARTLESVSTSGTSPAAIVTD